MVEPELIRKSDARAAVLHDSPTSTYCIDKIKPVDARINVYGVWLDAGKNVHGQNLTRCSVCNANSIEGGRFCRCCGAVMKQ
jgi:hypothetical protein